MTFNTSAWAELIVLAAPGINDPYYKEVADDIFRFHVSYAKQIMPPDKVLVLTDAQTYPKYAEAIGAENVFIAPMLDIWARDFSLSNAEEPILFRYTPVAQNGSLELADEVQEDFAGLLDDAGITYVSSELFNDGGNFVDDYAGNVVISTKFLKDNHLEEDEARALLQKLPQVRNVAFIEADEQGSLEHSDGVVSFVDTNTLIINSYPEDPAYARQLKADLKRGLPGVKIHEVVTPYDGSSIYDNRYGSACGLYTNALVTPQRIYLPQFGIPEDAVALQQVEVATQREVIPIASEMVCSMGGGVRCMSWQLRGENARKLLEYVAEQR